MRIPLGFVFLLVIPQTLWGESFTVIAKKDGVEVLSSPGTGSVVKILRSGETMVSQGRFGIFWKVQLDGNQWGFVSALWVFRKEQKAFDSGAFERVLFRARNQSLRQRSRTMEVRPLSHGFQKKAGYANSHFTWDLPMEKVVIPNRLLKKLKKSLQKERVRS